MKNKLEKKSKNENFNKININKNSELKRNDSPFNDFHHLNIKVRIHEDILAKGV